MPIYVGQNNLIYISPPQPWHLGNLFTNRLLSLSFDSHFPNTDLWVYLVPLSFREFLIVFIELLLF